MKISRYTFCFSTRDSEYYIYNALSNALIEVEYPVFAEITKYKKSRQDLPETGIDSELWNIMVDKYIATENDDDDFLVYLAAIINLRNKTDFMHMTIAPTMDCHFNCHYCFEQNKKKGNISESVMNSIVKYVCSCTKLETLKITWFGGEPLIAIHEIEMLYNKLKAEFISSGHPNRIIESDIITTGHALNAEVIKILQKIGITKMQITLDGNRKSHNRIKHTEGCDDAFTQVLRNIDLLTNIAPEIHITFRVNLTMQNISEYIPLYYYLQQRYEKYYIGIAPAFVMDRKSEHKNSVDFNYYFNRNLATKYVLDLFNKEHIHSPWLLYPKHACAECAIRNKLSVSFDPEGYAYKCWEVIGERKYAIGKLDVSGCITEINSTTLNRQLFGADSLSDKKCSKCSYLPICNGGCPLQRIQNKYEGWKNDCCTPYKGHLADFMKIHVFLKKNGYQNNL